MYIGKLKSDPRKFIAVDKNVIKILQDIAVTKTVLDNINYLTSCYCSIL